MRERPIHKHPDVVLARVGEHIGLDIAAEEVVGRLECLHRVASARTPPSQEALKFETPTWRILPSSTSAPNARALSAKGVEGSGQCTW